MTVAAKNSIAKKPRLTKEETEVRRLVNRYAALDAQLKDARLAMNKIKDELKARYEKKGGKQELWHGTKHTIKITEGTRQNFDMKQAVEDHGEDFFEDYYSETSYIRIGLSNKKSL